MAREFIFTGNAVDISKVKIYILESYDIHSDNTLLNKKYCEGYVDALHECNMISDDEQCTLLEYNKLHCSYR